MDINSEFEDIIKNKNVESFTKLINERSKKFYKFLKKYTRTIISKSFYSIIGTLKKYEDGMQDIEELILFIEYWEKYIPETYIDTTILPNDDDVRISYGKTEYKHPRLYLIKHPIVEIINHGIYFNFIKLHDRYEHTLLLLLKLAMKYNISMRLMYDINETIDNVIKRYNTILPEFVFEYYGIFKNYIENNKNKYSSKIYWDYPSTLSL